MNSYLAALFTFIITLVFLRLMYFLAERGVVPSELSRAIIQLGMGPIFVWSWLMYPDVQNGRWLAALTPLVVTLYVALIGAGFLRDNAASHTMIGTGERSNMLRGPLQYGIVLLAITLIYWKDSLIGIPALTVMCGGLGSAELLGNRITSRNLPWSSEKNITRSLSVFAGGWVMSILILASYVGMGTFSGPIGRFLLPVTWIALGGTLAESLATKDLDNILVPLACVLIGYLVFQI